MLSVSELTTQYENYSDEELFEIHEQVDNYSVEAKQALNVVVEQRGGLDRLLKSIADKKLINDEIKRIAKETKELGSKGVDASFINTITKSDILSAEQVKEIIDNKYFEVQAEIKEKTVDSRTIATSFIGGIIASVVGGSLFGVILVQSNRVPIFLIVLILLVCYGIIALTTGKSKNNMAVFIMTFISFGLSLLIGQLIYQIVA